MPVCGRAVSVLVPVAAAVAWDAGSAGRTLVHTLLLGAVWFAGLEAGVASSRTTLAALGTHVTVLRGTLYGLVLSAALAYVAPTFALGVGELLLVAAAIAVLASAWEITMTRVLPPRHVLLIGPQERCRDVIREFAWPENRSFAITGIVDDDLDVEEEPGGILLGTTDDLPRILDETRPNLVVLVPGCNRPQVFSQLLESAASGFKVLELAQLYEHVFGRVPVKDLTRAWFMSVLHLYQRPYTQLSKRTTDLVGAFLLVLLSAPLFPVLALAVRGSGRSILLRQRRVGEHGRVFTMYKFRTMRVDAELPGEAVWASKHDPRVTAAGRLMRRLRLDELPQVWNIFRGDMSLVGPRPERPEFIEELLAAVPFWERRHLVKPGITGWAQINRGYTADHEGSTEKLSYDLWYVRHRSLTVDTVICARTLWTIVRGEKRLERRSPLDELDPITALLHATTVVQPEVEG
jgi:exopolysaccharide biosynthesis polyprenyl glycosylphosphotransferase